MVAGCRAKPPASPALGPLPGGASALEGYTNVLVDERAVVMRRDAHRGIPPELVHDRDDLMSEEAIAVGVHTRGPLLHRVVTIEKRPQRSHEIRRRRRDQERGNGAMIESQSVCQRVRRASARAGRGRQQDLLLHANVAQQTLAERREWRGVDPSRYASGFIEQSLEPPVVGGKEAADRSGTCLGGGTGHGPTVSQMTAGGPGVGAPIRRACSALSRAVPRNLHNRIFSASLMYGAAAESGAPQPFTRITN